MILVGVFVHSLTLTHLIYPIVALPESFFFQYYFHIEFLKEQISVGLSHF